SVSYLCGLHIIQQYFNCLYVTALADAIMCTRFSVFLYILSFFITSTACRNSVSNIDISHDIKYLAAFSSPSLVTPADENKFNQAFQSQYKTRVVLLRPITAEANLSLSSNKVSLFAFIKINAQREARIVAREIATALGGSLVQLYPIAESVNSQDNFSGNTFYLSLEKRLSSFTRMNGALKQDAMLHEAESLSKDRNMLSYYAATILSNTPYHTLHILGYSGIAESQYLTLDGLFYRSIKKLDTADTVLLEKMR
ncbi:MAG TPA: hypothetical protein PLY93_13070, partial [Turneriella sp.]|nr:hypothetical protein [Turneriella sp.]